MLFEEKEKSIEKLIQIRTDQKISEYDAQAGFQIILYSFQMSFIRSFFWKPVLELLRKRKNFNCKTKSGNNFKRSHQTGMCARTRLGPRATGFVHASLIECG